MRFPSALIRAFVAGAVLVGLVRCDWSTAPIDRRALVVEAFLETGRSAPPITLRHTRPLSSSGRNDAATNAAVHLVLDGTRIPYREASPGRYVPTADSVVPPHVPWRLRAAWSGDTARARGRTPPRIDVQEVCVDVPSSPSRAIQVDSLRRDSLDIPADVGYIYTMGVTVRWGAEAARTDTSTWVRARLRPDASDFPSEVVEFFLQPAEVRREDRFATREGEHRWTGVYAVPVEGEDAPLPRHSLTTTLVRGDTAFASFAQTRTDPDRREPISNVEGGVGIAVAVSVDSLARSVEPGMERCRGPS